MKLKAKLGLGLLFLFLVILTYGILSIYYINRLNADSRLVLKDNLESLVYSNNMLRSIEEIGVNTEAANTFEINLKKQEANITEPGEPEATRALREAFTALSINPGNTSSAAMVRQSIQKINDVNQQAIVRKNAIAGKTAEDAIVWLTILFVVLGLVTFTFVVNFPSVIAGPVRTLNEGIRAIANKDYSRRIFLKQNDEFGQLAAAFNTMAEKLDEYESSNLAQLRFEKSRIETIINQMKDGIIGLDAKRNILFLNAVAEKLLGLKESDIAGKYIADVAVKNDLVRSLIQDNKPRELKIYADNKESYFNKDTLNVSNDGKFIGEVIVLRNITSFHELNEAKTNFIATVSHELKTPISSIKMSTQLLTDKRIGSLNVEQEELIKSIGDDSERLLKITSELLNLAQLETGQIQLNVKTIDPKDIIKSAIDTVRGKAKDKNISLNDISPGQLPMIEADADKTTWVLNNLLTNALKYSYPGTTIEISATTKDNHLLFMVSDKGPGIAEEYIPRLFERYFQVPGSTQKGTGLGLAISKDFIEAQGGHIWVESEIGKGSVFCFILPVKPLA